MDLSPAKQALLEKWLKGQSKEEGESLSRLPVNSPIPLSFPQQRQLFLELLEPGTAVNNLSVFYQVNGKLDLPAIQQSANKIIARHDVLRTAFSFGLGLPAPRVLPELRISIPIDDLQQFNQDEQLAEAIRVAEKEVLEPFNLVQAPLIRLKIFVLSKEKHLLLITIHHTIADGWSLGVFLHELMAFYQHITLGKPLQLPALYFQYPDFAYWQSDEKRGEALDTSLRYWKKQLGGELPVLELPVDHKRGARQTFTGGTYRFVLSTRLTEALDKFSREEDVTVFMTLVTVFKILLHRYSGQDDIIVGTPVANRNLPELVPLIGVFINTLALRTNLSGNPGFGELLERVKILALEAYSHQDLPFEKLVEALKPKRDLSRTPVFQVVFNLQNSPMPSLEIPGLSIIPLEIDRGVTQFDLALMMTRSEGKFRCSVEYNRDLFSPGTVARMFQSFQMLLESAIHSPNCPISKMQVMGKEEQDLLIYGLNQTRFDFPREKCVHELFEVQVRETPNAVAVIHDNTSISYSKLNDRANALAQHLQSLGVGPGIRVGIYMEKSLEIVEALLGVLKAGGTYVPIHTSFPAERVQFILNDASVKVLLTNVDHGQAAEGKVHIVNFKNENLSIGTDYTNPKIKVAPENLAYILYTSGSTGQPKGVMVQHAALTNFLWSMRKRPGIKSGDVLLSVTAISFDIAALELFLPLIIGATVIVASKEMTINPYMMGEVISRHRVNIMQATPSTWQLLIGGGWTGDPGLKALCGGETLSRNLADQLLIRVGSLWNMYGPTETTIWSSVCRVEKENNAITIGQPIGNTQLYILDHYMQPGPIGVVGELHIGGDGLSQGYLNLPGLTSEKFIRDCFTSKYGARLYKTGDLARYLPDYSIELLGRIDDQVKIDGHRIELGEIATVLMQHPSVVEAIVFSLEGNCGNKRLVAYIVPNNQGQLSLSEELPGYLKKKLPGYMIPSSFITIDYVPLTPNGKIDRKALHMPLDVRQAPAYVAPRNEEEETLAGIWQSVLGIGQVGIHDNFFDLGGASIQSLQVVAQANLAGFRISAETIFEYQTIAELAEQVKGGSL